MVNEAYPNRVNDLLELDWIDRGIRRDARRVPSVTIADAALHPGRVGIDRERGGRERDAVRHAGILAVQPLAPIPGRPAAPAAARSRNWMSSQRQRAAEQRCIEQIGQQVIEAEPQARSRPRAWRRRRRSSRVRRSRKPRPARRRPRRHARACRRRSCRSTNASTKKPAARISETRLEMVMVNRSLEAANAIIAGKQHQPDCVGDHVVSSRITKRRCAPAARRILDAAPCGSVSIAQKIRARRRTRRACGSLETDSQVVRSALLQRGLRPT